ncbi:MAG: hypothetical protein H6Q75_1039 [Firmicutes bacterium]|nr:hypothetical protein [Bacillota bacterium]
MKFLEYANSAEAKTKMLMTIRAFAYSALELFNSSTLIKNVKEEFEKSRCQ